MFNTISGKIIFVLGLIFFLMLPGFFLRSVISERQNWQQIAISSIKQSWSGPQQLGIGIISVPYTLEWTELETHKDTGREILRQKTVHKTTYLLPDDVHSKAALNTSLRARGIYEVPVYSAQLAFNGTFSTAPLGKILRDHPEKQITWGKPVFNVLVKDQRGIVHASALTWQQEKIPFRPGTTGIQNTQGMQAELPYFDISSLQKQEFSFHIDLQGMQSLDFGLLAGSSDVQIQADWPHPSFSGTLLPNTRNISEDGFTAHWKSSIFSSSANTLQKALEERMQEHSLYTRINFLGVNFVQPINIYQQSERSIKYVLLFLLLTFSSILLFELLGTTSVHPIQYTCVGFALLIFYLLLLSLAEHIGFGPAYAVSACACTTLQAVYFGGILKNSRSGFLLGGGLGLLYLLLYGILRSEDYAFIMGSVLLFALLAGLMLSTRRFDWYALMRAKQQKTRPSSEDIASVKD